MTALLAWPAWIIGGLVVVILAVAVICGLFEWFGEAFERGRMRAHKEKP